MRLEVPRPCEQGGYITCKDYPYQKLDGCACVCAPKDGKHCELHLQDGTKNKCDKTEYWVAHAHQQIEQHVSWFLA
jgi:hypothetical protein